MHPSLEIVFPEAYPSFHPIDIEIRRIWRPVTARTAWNEIRHVCTKPSVGCFCLVGRCAIMLIRPFVIVISENRIEITFCFFEDANVLRRIQLTLEEEQCCFALG